MGYAKCTFDEKEYNPSNDYIEGLCEIDEVLRRIDAELEKRIDLVREQYKKKEDSKSVNRKEDYANGRDVRNYFEQVHKMHANSLSPNIERITREEYLTITLEDLELATEQRTSL